MKNVFYATIALCIIVVTSNAQTTGDYRSVNSDSSTWNNKTNWEYYNGALWIPAESYPLQNGSPNQITIQSKSTISFNIQPTFQINKINIEDDATLVLDNYDFITNDSLKICGKLYNYSSVGTRIFNEPVILQQALIYSKNPNNFEFKKTANITNCSFDGDFPSTLIFDDSVSFKSNDTTVFNKISLDVYAPISFEGCIIFNSISGDKNFHNDTYFTNSELIINAGETFYFDKNITLTQTDLICNSSFNMNINQHMILTQANIERFENYLPIFFIAGNVIISENTSNTIEVGNIYCETIDTFGSINFSGKKGIKYIHNSCIVYNTGNITNSGNESFTIENDILNYGTIDFGNGTVLINNESSILNTNFYNLQIAGPINMLSNCYISNSLIFEDHATCNIQNYNLIFENSNNGSIQINTVDSTGIIRKNGAIIFNDLDSNNTVKVPLLINQLVHRIDITNLDTTSFDYVIYDIRDFFTDNGIPNSNYATENTNVNVMYYITSASTNSKIKLYWQETAEQAFFDRAFASIIHYNGTEWEPLETIDGIESLNGNIFSMSAKTTSFSPFSIQSTAIFLPIELTDFHLETHLSYNLLSWTTVSESNCEHFELQKSTGGINFKTFASVGCTNTNSKQIYNLYDNAPTAHYYRIKQVDYDGKYSFSKVIFDTSPNDLQIIATKNKVTVVYADQINSLYLYSMSGRLILFNLNTNSIDITEINKGNYILCVKTPKKSFIKTLNLQNR